MALESDFSAMPAEMKVGNGWTLGADPAKAGNQVLAFDGQADGANGQLTIDDALLQGPAWSMRFRSRFQTPWPGLVSGGKPDGAHFPNWSLAIGDGLTICDSYIWNALLLSGVAGVAGEQRLEGTRSPEAWNE